MVFSVPRKIKMGPDLRRDDSGNVLGTSKNYFDFFLRSFAARFSLSVFSGFFLVVFFESMPLLMIVLASERLR